MSYTPGPWEVPGTPLPMVYGLNGERVCRVIDNSADAPLISAAPDLYEALRELLEHIEYHCVTVGDCNQARAALAKAVKP